jgi:ABC-type transporter Mla MlaB component
MGKWMTISEARTWKSTPFSIEPRPGKAPRTLIFRLCGPFTARDMYSSLSPDTLRDILNFHSVPVGELPLINILDLSAVPYMDSFGLGMIVGHFASCQRKGLKMIAAGAGPRVRDLFKMTKVDNVIPMVATVEEVDV